ncbi:MAG: ABC transporter permease [Bryobacteraceae bacterium]|nr:ABC transporter permease [Bryobacteraceae bacterium]
MRLLSIYAVLAYAFLHLPLLVLTVFSFNHSRFTQWEGLSLRWYTQAFADPALREATLNSLLIGGAATALATALGTLCAYALWKKKSPLFAGALYLSLMTPEIVTGVALLAFYQWLFHLLDLQLGMFTVILAHVSFCLAYVVIVVIARLRTMDATLEEAALDLGANELQAFYKVTLPQLLPAIISAALLAFTISFDDFVITSLVAGVDSETLPMVMYATARRGVSPVLNAVSTVIVLGLGGLILLSERLQTK